MIPKVIHYCWFGGAPKPKSVLRCINSWKKHCPDFEIREWTEKDFDVTQNEYTRQAYEAKAWGFVPDYIRLWIIYHHGGFYLDTDVQVIKNLSPLCNYPAFAGFQEDGYVALGLGFGAELGNPFIGAHMQQYEALQFISSDGIINNTPSPVYTNLLLEKWGLDIHNGVTQDLGDIIVFSKDYFCPKDFTSGITKVTQNTYSIHQFDASWYSEEQQEKKKKRWKEARRRELLYNIRYTPNRIVSKLLGKENYQKLKHFFGKD